MMTPVLEREARVDQWEMSDARERGRTRRARERNRILTIE